MAESTPMINQYKQIKKKYSDCILFFRLGDFYEMFYEDAVIGARELELTLTGRGGNRESKEGRAPMCGVPFHSADSYIARLVEKGYKVAICEQMEDPASAEGKIVKRDVIKVVTPGTLTDSQVLHEKQNHYLGCVFADDAETALVFSDISTGEVFLTSIRPSSTAALINELSVYAPKELIFNDVAANLYQKAVCERFDSYIGSVDAAAFSQADALERIEREIQLGAADRRHLSDDLGLCCALGALVYYLLDTQKTSLHNILSLKFYEIQSYMGLDACSRRNLEITQTMRDKSKRHSLLWVLDKTKTSMGGRLLKQWVEKPLVNIAAINKRQQGVGELVREMICRHEICDIMGEIYDISRLIGRISLGTATPRDMISLKQSLRYLPALKNKVSLFHSDILKEVCDNIDPLEDICDLLERGICDEPPMNLREGGVIKEGFDTKVDEYRTAMREGKNWLADVQSYEREQTGIKNLKVGYNKVFGYYIEVSKGQVSQVPPHYVRKQTLVNGERYITQKLKDIESLIIGAQDRLIRLEAHLFEQLRSRIGEQIERLKRTAAAVATLDALASLAQTAQQNSYVMPEMTTDGSIQIQDGRHPVVECVLKGELFVPNDTLLDNADNRLVILTGPNMAGKSTYMRQVALICLMAQVGSFVPARSARLGIVDQIFTRVGASDDLASGQSTFMVEMNEVSNILAHATKDSLIIFDEIGRGTSTFDGLSIAWAVAEHVADKKRLGAKTLFATHYRELTELEDRMDGVKNYNIAVKKRGDDITFLRKIVRGGADGSYGIEVAALAGVPKDVLSRAKHILKELEQKDINHVQHAHPEGAEAEPAAVQVGLANTFALKIVEELKNLDVTTLTPIEALNRLYALANESKQV